MDQWNAFVYYVALGEYIQSADLGTKLTDAAGVGRLLVDTVCSFQPGIATISSLLEAAATNTIDLRSLWTFHYERFAPPYFLEPAGAGWSPFTTSVSRPMLPIFDAFRCRNSYMNKLRIFMHS